MRHVNAETLALLKQWEGLVLYAYDDADGQRPPRRIMPGMAVRGTLTIGYGHTGADVRPGLAIDEAQAEDMLRLDLAPCERAVERLVTVPLSDNQFGTLVSFAFNAGIPALQGSTLLKRLNGGGYESVPGQLMRWSKTTIAGRLVDSPGLVNRRAAEVGLWSRGSFVASNTVEVQPKAQPMGKSDVAAGVAVGSGAATTIVGLVSDYGSLIDRAQYWFAGHTGLGIAAGVVLLGAVAWLVWSRLRRKRG